MNVREHLKTAIKVAADGNKEDLAVSIKALLDRKAAELIRDKRDEILAKPTKDD